MCTVFQRAAQDRASRNTEPMLPPARRSAPAFPPPAGPRHRALRRAASGGLLALALGATWPVRLTAGAPPEPGLGPPTSAGLLQPESNRMMAARLEKFTHTDNPFKSPPRMEEAAAVLRERLARTTDVPEMLQLKMPFALRLMQSGKLDEALKEFEDYELLMKASGRTLTAAEFTPLVTSKGMCHLRMGELENCLLNHNGDSCLLPIRGGGVHQLPRGSRNALKEFTALVQSYPGDLRARWLLNIAYMTLGEYPDKVPPAWLIDPQGFSSDYEI